MAIKVLIAPSGFKESLEPDEVADCIAAGILRAAPDAKIYTVPLVDGGEGFAKALVGATGGTLHKVAVTGPVGQPVEAHYGFLGKPGAKTAVFEIAAAAGLRHVPRDARDPLKTTTYGVGELVKAALDAGAQRFLIGSGDSGTNDGGAGMAQALGVRLLDASGNDLGLGGGELLKLESIDISGRDPRIAQVKVDVACNLHTVLCGPNGVARFYGPQKGASPKTVELLVDALERYAAVIHQELGLDVRTMPGGGGSGGLVAGLHVFANATLNPCYDIVMKYLDFDELLRDTDLVITAEGCLDFQTTWGKIPGEVARRAKPYGVPVIALTGMIGQGARESLFHGIESFLSILDKPTTLSEAMENASELLTDAAERAMRLILVGQKVRKPSIPDIETLVKRHQLYQEANNGADELEVAKKVQSELLKTISRELRTPLNLVMGYTAMIKDRILGEINQEQEKALSRVMRHCLVLFGMVSGLQQATQEGNRTVPEDGHERDISVEHTISKRL